MVSPVIGFLVLMIASLGIAVAYVEGWTIGEGIYFAFVTALTIGYGDVTAKRTLGRVIAIFIGFTGLIFSGVIVAVAVQSLRLVLLETYGNVEDLQVQDASFGVLDRAREHRKAKREERKGTPKTK
jgi:hypothetical protein